MWRTLYCLLLTYHVYFKHELSCHKRNHSTISVCTMIMFSNPQRIFTCQWVLQCVTRGYQNKDVAWWNMIPSKQTFQPRTQNLELILFNKEPISDIAASPVLHRTLCCLCLIYILFVFVCYLLKDSVTAFSLFLCKCNRSCALLRTYCERFISKFLHFSLLQATSFRQ